MHDMMPREIERYIAERTLPGRIGNVRITGPVANDDLYVGPPDRVGRIHSESPQRPIGSLSRWIGGGIRIAGRIRQSMRRARAKRQTYQVLSSMNQSMLWDIGIGPRANIPSVVEAVHSHSPRNCEDSTQSRPIIEVTDQALANELNRQAVA